MPQLAPISWILCFMWFWGSVMFISLLIWWVSGSSLKVFVFTPKGVLSSVWGW